MHVHSYDSLGNQICCLETRKKPPTSAFKNERVVACCSAEESISHDHADDDHSHYDADRSLLSQFLPAIVSFILLIAGLAIDHLFPMDWFSGTTRILWYVAAYIPVGIPVNKQALDRIFKGDVFSEFFLMSIATIGAFAIGVYPEAVAVMLFYTIGELFQDMSVHRAELNIKALLDQRPDTATIIRNVVPVLIQAYEVRPGDILQLKPGEKLALDGELLTDFASFNTSALTGESTPDSKYAGDEVLAGMINLRSAAQVRVTKEYEDSKLSKILELVQEASSQKAPTELFISKFAKIYTPIVVFLAAVLCLLPYFFVENYVFSEWLYRSLIFLVISCPCALVISIPLGYFGGIGAASRNGILVKGSNFLDTLASIENVVMDKTGTMTEGVFKVQDVILNTGNPEILALVNTLESVSTHPVATAIHDYLGPVDHSIQFEHREEIAGYGLRAIYNGKELLVGNFPMMDKFDIQYDIDPNSIVFTTIAIAFDKEFVGYIIIADEIKEDAQRTIQTLHKLNVKTTMLSGDKSTVVHEVAAKLGIDNAFGDLLPQDKVEKVNLIKARNESVAFVGDGVNDAPVVAVSDVGLAMGGLGSDATIETADVVIQDDNPFKIPMAIKIGKQTKKIVWQNIALAFGVKAIVLILGAGGIASMWEAVFADVGVALLAILNAVRIQRMDFTKK